MFLLVKAQPEPARHALRPRIPSLAFRPRFGTQPGLYLERRSTSQGLVNPRHSLRGIFHHCFVCDQRLLGLGGGSRAQQYVLSSVCSSHGSMAMVVLRKYLYRQNGRSELRSRVWTQWMWIPGNSPPFKYGYNDASSCDI